MVTFYDIKQFLCKIVGSKVDNDDDDIIIENRYFRGKEFDKMFIYNNELKELYNKVKSMRNNELELYTENNYEIAVDLDYLIIRRQEFNISSEDNTNAVEYELKYPTAEYSLYLLMIILEYTMNQQNRDNNLIIRFKRNFDRTLYNLNDNKDNISLTDILPKLIGELSLKIKTINNKSKSLDEFRKFKTAFVFEFMYKTGNSLVEFLNIEDMFQMNHIMRNRLDRIKIDTPPLRRYNADVVDYYKQGLASNDPYIKFISFYHVMEYFYDEVFKKKLITDLKNKITHPDFSYKNEEKIYEIALFVKNRMRMNDETGQGNELESLKYVLNKYISIDELKERINSIDIDAINYYRNNKVSFCDAPTISWSDSEGVFKTIAKRIYFTRNSLVHSKSGKNKQRYHPYKDENKLKLEIPLVKAVAEAIIINSSEII